VEIFHDEGLVMTFPQSNTVRCFSGNLEQCIEQYGGASRFNVASPTTFFSGARLETSRRARSEDGSVLIVESQSKPAVCEVYVRPTAGRVPPARQSNMRQSNCA
jgi:hypothetical protein